MVVYAIAQNYSGFNIYLTLMYENIQKIPYFAIRGKTLPFLFFRQKKRLGFKQLKYKNILGHLDSEQKEGFKKVSIKTYFIFMSGLTSVTLS